MSFFNKMFGNNNNNNPNQQHNQSPQQPDQTNPNPQSAGFARPAGAGFGPTVVNPNAAQLARARQQRQAGLAGAVFGQQTNQFQPQSNPGFTPGGPGFAPQSNTPEPASNMGGGGDMFDMFGGLDVKAPAAGSLPNSSSFGQADAPVHQQQEEEPSGFSFIDDSQPTSQSYDPEQANSSYYDPNAASTEQPGAESNFSFMGGGEASTASEPSSFDFVASPPSTAPIIPVGSSNLDTAKSYLDQSLSGFWQEWRQLAQSESQLKQDEVQLQLSIRRDTASLRETEDKQGAAVAAEEYEKADSFNSEMDRLKQSISSHQEKLLRTRSDIQYKESQKVAAVERAITILKASSSQLENINSERQQELASFITKRTAELSEQDKSINSDLNQVKQSLSTTQADLDSIATENADIDAALESEIAPFVTEKSDLAEAQSKLESELEELRRQIAAKEREISDNLDKQTQADRAIDLVRSKFDQQRTFIDDKRSKIDALRAGDINQQQAIERRAEALDKDIEAAKAHEHSERVVLHDIADHLAHARYLTALLEREARERAAFYESLSEDETRIEKLRDQLTNYESNLTSVRSELMAVEQSIEQHNANINNVNAKVPSLETEKNVAVAARDFKKAAAASKDIKTLQQSKADSEAAIETLRATLASHTQTLATADTGKGEIEREMLQLEDGLDRKRLHFLIVHEAKLSARQARTNELLQRAYSNDSGNVNKFLDHLQKEVESTSVELQWTQVEIRELRAKHSWGDDNDRASDSELAEEDEAVVVNHVDDPSLFDTIKQHGGIFLNGDFDQTKLGLPVIEASAQAALASPRATASKTKIYSQDDLTSVQSQLDERRISLSSNEEALALAVEAEEFEQAAELEDIIAKERVVVADLAEKVAQIELALAEQNAAVEA